MSSKPIPIAVAEGDGIGPEIMAVTLNILKAANANIEIKKIAIGEKMYLSGQPAGIAPESWEVLRNTKAFLKAPITTPQGGGFKSLNVTVRTTLGLYANIRPCVAYYPFVATKHPGMDVVIVRENEEDLYTGIEYRQSADVYTAMKIISRGGSEKIIRYAFEYAQAHDRKKVTCFTKDNIMKMTDGAFHKIFDEIAKLYPHVEAEHWIVDIGAAKLADTPTAFDVVVLPNLYGDILSDVAAQIAGSVGLAGSANIGIHGAMFEAIHGSAPRRAGQNLANPSGLILASVLMLNYLGLDDVATTIHNAWLKTIEDGIHTYDIFKDGISKEKVGTKEFGEAVIKRLGQIPTKLKPATTNNNKALTNNFAVTKDPAQKKLVGVDIFIQHGSTTDELQKSLSKINVSPLKLSMISNRGTRVWPSGAPETFLVDIYRCRFVSETKDGKVTHKDVSNVLSKLSSDNIDYSAAELLFTYDGKPGYAVSQEEQ